MMGGSDGRNSYGAEGDVRDRKGKRGLKGNQKAFYFTYYLLSI